MRREIRKTLVFIFLSTLFGAFIYLQLARGLFSGEPTPSPVKPNSVILRYDANEQSLIQENQGPSSSLYNRKTELDAVLLPDWEILLVLLPSSPENPFPGKLCLFQNGDKSPARPAGNLLWGNRSVLRCKLPPSVRRLRPFEQPVLVSPENDPIELDTSPEMIRWSFLVYETLSTETDVILFAKGVNSRQGSNFPAKHLRCVFESDDNKVYTPLVSSSQEVFRCLHPESATRHSLSGHKISLEIEGRIIPSVVYYNPQSENPVPAAGKYQLCACTMVFNVAKFLKEWVIYHSSLGVEHFILYDNGSEDDLEKVLEGLKQYNVRRFVWPWPKTQEAGFSHCATSSMGSCKWMMFTDVDEFVFSPSWKNLTNPSPLLLKSLLPKKAQLPNRSIGQIWIRCFEFGPSDRRSHPSSGVTQGYNCRRRSEQRHKSIVLLEAIDRSLLNVVHHFQLKKGYRVKKVGKEEGIVNHYKYQAWSEFKAKFRRRVSTYVVDWRQTRNPGSKDRTPGLGYAPIEPLGWASRFCEVNDSRLQRLTRRWFGLGKGAGSQKMLWEDE